MKKEKKRSYSNDEVNKVTIPVYSPIDDKNIKKNVKDSPIWKTAYHAEELSDAPKSKEMFEYTIKFENTTPVQVTKIKKL